MEINDISNASIQIKKILLATDGSTPSIIATQYAVALAKVLGANLKAIFVDANENEGVHPEAGLVRSTFKEVQPSTAGLDVVNYYSEKNDIGCETEVIYGSVARTIIKTAEDYDADVIIVGNTGRTGLRRLTLGSVAEDVVKNSRIPVLVLKAS